LHRLGKGFQEWEEKRAEAKIAQRIGQIPLMEAYDLHPILSMTKKYSVGFFNLTESRLFSSAAWRCQQLSPTTPKKKSYKNHN
jgi:hypothetical protein